MLADPGLQPERTELAWRRTSLAVALGSLVALRVLPDALQDPRWMLAGVGGVAAAAVMWLTARARYRRVAAVMRGLGSVQMPGGAALAVIGAGALALGLGSTIIVLRLAI
ncbi:DUF202 domain-containing protein [Leucobacter sp. W1038]|uniref:DUF202 domain-containing protein n=1 Tax=Leucobacter sp. W1038 TaxID=3438281 RepID=UPI003D98BD44